MAEVLNKKGVLIAVTLLSIIAGFIPSLIYWFVGKKSLEPQQKSFLVDLLNFELTLFIIGLIVGAVFAPLAGLISLLNLVFIIIATLALSNDKEYKFPFAIPLFK